MEVPCTIQWRHPKISHSLGSLGPEFRLVNDSPNDQYHPKKGVPQKCIPLWVRLVFQVAEFLMLPRSLPAGVFLLLASFPSQVQMYLESQAGVPWITLNYIIAEAFPRLACRVGIVALSNGRWKVGGRLRGFVWASCVLYLGCGVSFETLRVGLKGKQKDNFPSEGALYFDTYPHRELCSKRDVVNF